MENIIIEELSEEYRTYFEFSNGEVILNPVNTIEEIYEIISNIMNISKRFTTGSNPHICSLKKSYAYNKQTGIESKDKSITWRIDYDIVHGVHVHYENIYFGKRSKAIKILIPINITYQAYENIIDKWNGRVLRK